jgi:5-methylcytosine-specific restriction endonuclease McrA
MARPCIEPGCTLLAERGSRCRAHSKARGAVKNRRRRALAPPGGAAGQLRRALDRAGIGTCATCLATLAAKALEVDHHIALSDGGRDSHDNLVILCRDCHVAKTTAEGRRRREGGAPRIAVD